MSVNQAHLPARRSLFQNDSQREYLESMKRTAIICLCFAIAGTPIQPAMAASKAVIVSSAFQKLLIASGDSLDSLDQKYETDIDKLDAELASAKQAASAQYDQEILAATNLYGPQLAEANKKMQDAKGAFEASNKVKVGPGGGFFGGSNLANYLDCLIDPKTLRKLKRYCSENLKIPVVGTGTYDGNEWPDWNVGDITTIQLFNADEKLVQEGIGLGYILPLNQIAFDTNRIAYKTQSNQVVALTLQQGNARKNALGRQDKVIEEADNVRASTLKDLTDTYEQLKTDLESSQLAAETALLAAKRASKDSTNFDKAFAVAYKFEYNRQMLNQIADDAWTGEWTFRTIDSIIKVSRLANSGDAISTRYSMKNATAFNSMVGSAFTNQPDFRAALKVLTALYKKTTKTTLQI